MQHTFSTYHAKRYNLKRIINLLLSTSSSTAFSGSLRFLFGLPTALCKRAAILICGLSGLCTENVKWNISHIRKNYHNILLSQFQSLKKFVNQIQSKSNVVRVLTHFVAYQVHAWGHRNYKLVASPPTRSTTIGGWPKVAFCDMLSEQLTCSYPLSTRRQTIGLSFGYRFVNASYSFHKFVVPISILNHK